MKKVLSRFGLNPAIKELVKYELFMIIWWGFICFVLMPHSRDNALYFMGGILWLSPFFLYETFGGRIKVLNIVRTLFTGDPSVPKP